MDHKHKAKKNGNGIPDIEKWELIEKVPGQPKQNNFDDCGVFSCFFAYCLVHGLQTKFLNQKFVNQHKLREQICLWICKKKID